MLFTVVLPLGVVVNSAIEGSLTSVLLDRDMITAHGALRDHCPTILVRQPVVHLSLLAR